LLEGLGGPVRPVLEALLGAVLMVLLIASANVASLLLARGLARQRELAVRMALGSGRGRLLVHLLSESLVIAIAGGALGVALAAWGTDALLALAPPTLPRLNEVRLDGGVLPCALLASLGSRVLAGVAPAVQASRPDVVEVLKSGSAGPAPRNRLAAALVVTEVAIAVVLASGAGLMIRTLTRLLDESTGLRDPARVLVADLDLP